MMGRLLDWFFGMSAAEAVRQDAERVIQEARSMLPAEQRDRLAQSLRISAQAPLNVTAQSLGGYSIQYGGGLLHIPQDVNPQPFLNTSVDGWGVRGRDGVRGPDGVELFEDGERQYLSRKLNGEPYLSTRRPGQVETDQELSDSQIKELKDRWESECGDPGPLPFMIPPGLDLDPDNPMVQILQEHAERALTGGHDWIEVNLVDTDQVVAWYCRKCDEQKYADGW